MIYSLNKTLNGRLLFTQKVFITVLKTKDYYQYFIV